MTHEKNQSATKTVATSFQSSIWFSVILIGLFIAAINFVHVMSESSHGGEETHTEATSSQTLKGESGSGLSTTEDTADQNH